jgi:hypothetical protein
MVRGFLSAKKCPTDNATDNAWRLFAASALWRGDRVRLEIRDVGIDHLADLIDDQSVPDFCPRCVLPDHALPEFDFELQPQEKVELLRFAALSP